MFKWNSTNVGPTIATATPSASAVFDWHEEAGYYLLNVLLFMDTLCPPLANIVR